MNWSKKMWALQYEDGTFVSLNIRQPFVASTRGYARYEKKYYPTAKVVRVQVDVKVIE